LREFEQIYHGKTSQPPSKHGLLIMDSWINWLIIIETNNQWKNCTTKCGEKMGVVH
jgi:hypothetical protein